MEGIIFPPEKHRTNRGACPLSIGYRFSRGQKCFGILVMKVGALGCEWWWIVSYKAFYEPIQQALWHHDTSTTSPPHGFDHLFLVDRMRNHPEKKLASKHAKPWIFWPYHSTTSIHLPTLPIKKSMPICCNMSFWSVHVFFSGTRWPRCGGRFLFQWCWRDFRSSLEARSCGGKYLRGMQNIWTFKHNEKHPSLLSVFGATNLF